MAKRGELTKNGFSEKAVFWRCETGKAYIKSVIRAIFKQARLLSPTRQEIYNSLAQITLMQGKTQEARKLLEEAVSLNPTVSEFYWNLYLVDYKLGDKQAAKESLFKARLYDYGKQTKIMHSLPALRQMISFYKDIGDYRQLPALYEEAIRLKPGDEELRQEFIEAKEKLGFDY